MSHSASGELRYAGYGARVGATLVDALVLVVPAVILAIFFGITTTPMNAQASHTNLTGTLISTFLTGAYCYFRFVRYDGQTIGNRAAHSRVMKEDGTRLDQATAGLRVAITIAFQFLMAILPVAFLLVLADYLWPLWDDRNQTLHDKLAKTVVVKV